MLTKNNIFAITNIHYRSKVVFFLTMGKPKNCRLGKYYPPDPDKPDEDIINESIHLLNIGKDELIELLTNSNKTRRFKRQERLVRNGTIKKKKPPRPQNRFIIYKRYKLLTPEFKDKPKKDRKVKSTSKVIGSLWQTETEEVLKLFCAFERVAEEWHRKTYGDDYKYEKEKKRQRKSRKTKNKRESSMSSDCFSTESSSYYQTSQSSTDSISSDISLHSLQDSTSLNLSLQNQYTMNDDNLGDSTPPNLILHNQTPMSVENHLASYNQNIMNDATFEANYPPDLISHNQNIMNDVTVEDYDYYLANCTLGDLTPPNLISHNQNTMSVENYSSSYTHGDSTSSNLSSQNLNLIGNPNLTDYPSDTEQSYYLVDRNTYTQLCYLQLQVSLILSEYL
jgi:hypothetical protein